jgi:glucose dehydrogenase
MSTTVPAAFSPTKAPSMSRIRVQIGVLIRALAILFCTLAHPAAPANAQADWTTFAFDMQRTGFNPHESILGPQTVSNLHLLWSVDLGGAVTAQATLLSNVETSTGTKAIVYVSTLLGDVFALNAADGAVV